MGKSNPIQTKYRFTVTGKMVEIKIYQVNFHGKLSTYFITEFSCYGSCRIPKQGEQNAIIAIV